MVERVVTALAVEACHNFSAVGERRRIGPKLVHAQAGLTPAVLDGFAQFFLCDAEFLAAFGYAVWFAHGGPLTIMFHDISITIHGYANITYADKTPA